MPPCGTDRLVPNNNNTTTIDTTTTTTGQEKMSKSDPDSAIFMEDTEADLKVSHIPSSPYLA